MKYLYRLYQLCVVYPLVIVVSIIIATITVVGCTVGNGHVWGYYPGQIGRAHV